MVDLLTRKGAMMEKGLFNKRVYEVVRRIPKGKVATYGQVAVLAGAPRNARFVGYALHSNPEPGVIPCHRVVFRDGSLAPGFAFGGPERQRLLLEEEGVAFILPKGMSELSESGEMKDSNAGASGLRVDLARCLWDA
ncbi:MGMT family protein [Bifidobacterium hominis]